MKYERILFDEWNNKKKNIHSQKKQAKVKQGRIYWVKIGQNVGCEVYGKGDDFVRPVIVLKCFKILNILYFIGVPLSTKTKNKSGAMFYKFVDSKGNEQVALLSQIRVFDSKRASNRIGAEIKSDDFVKLKEKLKAMF